MKAVLNPPVRSLSGVLVIDKAEGWTSHDVVAKIRRLLKVKKVGHTGTLDPMGTGVLPICVGDATKIAGYAQMADKTYRVTMQLGVATDTQDRTGEVVSSMDLDDAVDWDTRVREALAGMVGDSLQTPPMYAAVKIGGEALYKKARRGETVEREPRKITIYDITDVEVSLPYVHFSLSCTKGTYVRTVAADVGEALGVGAHLTRLQRTVCGPITIDEAITIDELAVAVEEGRAMDVLQPEDHLLGDLPKLAVSEYTARRMVQGIAPQLSEWRLGTGEGELDRENLAPGTLCRVHGDERGFFALVETSSDPLRPAKLKRIVKTKN